MKIRYNVNTGLYEYCDRLTGEGIFYIFTKVGSEVAKKAASEVAKKALEKAGMLHIKVRLPVLLCAVKTVEGDFRFCWTTTPNVGQTHKENPNLVRILYMVCTLNDIYKQYNKLHEH